LTVLNKIDLLGKPENPSITLNNFPNAIALSALTGEGVADLLTSITDRLYQTYDQITVKLPYHQGALISMFHELGQVDKVEHLRGGVVIQGRLPGRLFARFKPFLIGKNKSTGNEK
jgi:GTP-binding protein HflX